jgi:WD40 repeat protein
MIAQPPMNPFVGPREFQTGETLFGRERETRELLRQLVSERIVLFHSPSGAGKSSLLNAGLVPLLGDEGFHVWPVIRVNTAPAWPDRPQAENAANRYVLSVLNSLKTGVQDSAATAADAFAPSGLSEFFARTPGGLKREDQVLIFDQFEEVLTVDPDDLAGKQAFFEQVGALLRYGGYYAVFALRDDYVGALEPYRRWVPGGLGTHFRLDLLGEAAAHEAILKPTEGSAAPFTGDDAGVLVDNLRGQGVFVEPVLLQVVCYRLWERHHAAGGISEGLVADKSADVDAALQAFYSEQVRRICADQGLTERRVREWCQKLITTEGKRRLLQGSEGADLGLPTKGIDALIDARIVRADERRNEKLYELAHDRLVQPIRDSNAVWQEERLQLWQRRAKLYSKEPRNDLLLLDDQLDPARTWADEHADEVNPDDMSYLRESARVRADRREKLQFWGVALGILVVSAAAMVVLASWALASREAARHAARVASKAEQATDKALQQATTDRTEARRTLAIQSLSQGISLGEEGQVAQCLHWLARGLDQAQQIRESDPQLERLFREELASWQFELNRLGAVLTQPNRVGHIALTRDGVTALTVCDDNTAQLWDVATGQRRGNPLKHDGPVMAVAFSGDGRTALTGSKDRSARLWDVGTAQPKGPLLRHDGEVVAVAFSPDGRTAISGSFDYTARLWEVATGNLRGSPLKHDGPVRAVAFSPDGRTALTGSDDKTARLWDVTTGRPKGPPLSHDGLVFAVAFFAGGRNALTGSGDYTAQVWDVATGQPLGTQLRRDGQVMAVAPSADGGTALIVDGDPPALLWDLATGKSRSLETPGYNRDYTGAFTADGLTVLTGTVDGMARLWDVATVKPKGPPLRHGGPVDDVAITANGHIALTAARGSSARVWYLFTGQLQRPPVKHDDAVDAVALSSNGRTAITGALNGKARVWDVATGKPQGLPINHDAVLVVALSGDGRTALTGGGDDAVRVWDVSRGQPKGPPLKPDSSAWAVALSADGRTALTGGGDRGAQLWDVSTGQPKGPPLKHDGTDFAVALSADGRTAMTGGDDDAARVWDLSTRQPKGPPLMHDGPVFAVALSADSRTALTGSGDYTARLWDVSTGQPKGQPLRHKASVQAVAFSADGRIALTGDSDNTARLWDVATGRPKGPPLKHDDQVRAVAFTEDGRFAVTATVDGEARLWPVPAHVEGSVNQIRLWVEAMTGLEMDEAGGFHSLNAEAWESKLTELRNLGGPPEIRIPELAPSTETVP